MAKKPDQLSALLAASFKTSEVVAVPSPPVAAPQVSQPVELPPAPSGVSEAPPPVVEETPVVVVPAVVPVEAAAISEDPEPEDSREAEAEPGVSETPAKPRAPRKPKVAPEPEPEPPPYEFEGCRKTTVSFYATEQAKVDEILDTLIKVRRHRGGFSDAIKIALRLCPTDPQSIAAAWDNARAADKRTQRARRAQ